MGLRAAFAVLINAKKDEPKGPSGAIVCIMASVYPLSGTARDT